MSRSQYPTSIVKEITSGRARSPSQIAGGLGGAIAELICENQPLPLGRIGVHDHFGESGTPAELFEKFHLTAPHIVAKAREVLKRKGDKQ